MIDAIITGTVALISAILGSSVIYFRQNKRSKEIDNDLKTTDAWKELYHEKEKKCNDKDAKIDELRRHINSLQSDKIKMLEGHQKAVQELQGELSVKEIKLIECNWYRCEVTGCPNRRPPRDLDETSTTK